MSVLRCVCLASGKALTSALTSLDFVNGDQERVTQSENFTEFARHQRVNGRQIVGVISDNFCVTNLVKHLIFKSLISIRKLISYREYTKRRTCRIFFLVSIRANLMQFFSGPNTHIGRITFNAASSQIARNNISISLIKFFFFHFLPPYIMVVSM